jgi:hypothetical protein
MPERSLGPLGADAQVRSIIAGSTSRALIIAGFMRRTRPRCVSARVLACGIKAAPKEPHINGGA